MSMILKTCIGILLAAAITACAQLPAPPVNSQMFESVPGKAVVFLVRTLPDIGELPATLWLDDAVIGSTHPGTYFRWELAPGAHRINGYGVDTGSIRLDLQPGRVYFIRHSVVGTFRAPSPHSVFQILNDAQGRDFVARATRSG